MAPVREFRAGEDEALDAFLREHPRAMVLYKAIHCPYGATFYGHFRRHAEEDEGRAHALASLDEADDAAWDRRGVDLSPTVVLYHDGKEAARLRGAPLLGLTRQRFSRWLRGLP